MDPSIGKLSDSSDEDKVIKRPGDASDIKHDRLERPLKLLLDKAKQWSKDAALREIPNITDKDIENLRVWCKENNILPRASVLREHILTQRTIFFTICTDYQLVAFLHCCAGDIDRVHSVMRVYHNIRDSTPEVFSNRTFQHENIRKALALGYFCILPNKTPEGFQIILQSLRNPDPTEFNYANCCKTYFLAIDSCIRAEPTAKGYILVNDMKGATMAHVWKWGFTLPRKIFSYVQEGMPLRIRQIHFVNTTPLMDRMMRMVRPLLHKEALALLNFHTPDDMDRFFAAIPRHCIPEDFGGDLPTVEELQGVYFEDNELKLTWITG